MAVCYGLEKGWGVWVSGPARVRVVEGSVLGSGYVVGAGGEALVRGERGYTFYAIEPSRVCVEGGSGSSSRVVREGWDVVVEWLRLLDLLEDEGVRRVAVLGPPEAGKSTLTAWVANRLRLSIVEADIGQNELGLPSCVSRVEWPGESFLVLQDLQDRGVSCYFVGHVSAGTVPDLVVAAASAATRLSSSGYVLDSDGFVYGRGLSYKLALLEALNPDAVIVAGDRWLLGQIEAAGHKAFYAPPPGEARVRSRGDRRAYRSRQWARLFAASKPVVVEASPVRVCGFDADADGSIVYHCQGGDIVVSRRRPGTPGARWLRPGWEKGLVAAVGGGGAGECLVLVERLDPASGRAVVRPARGCSVAERGRLVLGWVKLSEPGYGEEHLEPLPYPEAVAVSARRRGRR